jgi:plasmid maintenance system antidote protein VapI
MKLNLNAKPESKMSNFQPSKPVDTLLDLADENNMNRIQLAEALNISDDYLTNIIDGIYPITFISDNIVARFGGSVEFWYNRQLNYTKAMLEWK